MQTDKMDPPPYGMNGPAYPPPNAGHQFQQQGYQAQAYPGPSYPPPQQPYYPPPQQPYYPPPAGQQQQSTNNVVVVNAGAPTTNTVIVERRGVNHVLHFIITLFFWPWIIVWIILCIMDGS